MKEFVLGLLVISASSVLATKELYNAMDVKQVVKDNGWIKESNGISCVKKIEKVSGTTYECNVKTEKLNSEALYNLLNVAEEGVMAPRSVTVTEKISGNLKCLKIEPYRGAVKYSCSIKL